MSTKRFILYKTTNSVNGKIYIGIHTTSNIEDGYLGSGTLLSKAILKHGKENFSREIIAEVDSIEELEKLEIEFVTEEFCKRDDVYNLMPGGRWGSKLRNGLSFEGKHHSEESIKKMVESRESKNYSVSEETKQKLRDNSFSKSNPDKQREVASKAGKVGGSKPKSEEHKRKIAEAIKRKHEERKRNSGVT